MKICALIAKVIKEALFPRKCLICGSFFHPEQSKSSGFPEKDFNESFSKYNKNFNFEVLMAPFLCSTCSTGFLPVESPICSKCGIMFKSREGEDHICGECLKSPKRFRVARATGVYDQALMELIHCLKYKGKIQLAHPLGILLFSAFIRYWDKKSIDLIVPVPLHAKRFKARGFNQAFLLIRQWSRIAEALNVELSDIHVDKHVLARCRWTESQAGLGRKKRLINIKNAFGLIDASKIKGKRILLVDDVYTTGATADECAKVLLQGGAEYVDILTLARGM